DEEERARHGHGRPRERGDHAKLARHVVRGLLHVAKGRAAEHERLGRPVDRIGEVAATTGDDAGAERATREDRGRVRREPPLEGIKVKPRKFPAVGRHCPRRIFAHVMTIPTGRYVLQPRDTAFLAIYSAKTMTWRMALPSASASIPAFTSSRLMWEEMSFSTGNLPSRHSWA